MFLLSTSHILLVRTRNTYYVIPQALHCIMRFQLFTASSTGWNQRNNTKPRLLFSAKPQVIFMHKYHHDISHFSGVTRPLTHVTCKSQADDNFVQNFVENFRKLKTNAELLIFVPIFGISIEIASKWVQTCLGLVQRFLI